MKKIILIILLASSIYAQEENQSQSIELPDFVITGKESISIQKAKKSEPDFIPLLSNDFFIPQYPNEEIITIRLPEVENEVVSIGNYSQTTNAFLRISAGLKTFPKGEFFYNNWSNNFSYNAHLFGLNELEFEKHAGLSMSGGKIGGSYFVDQTSNILPGLEIALNGSFVNESFNFYGSSTPSLNRITNNGIVDLNFNYVNSSNINFGIKFNNAYYEQKDDAIDENIFSTEGFLNFKVNNFNFKIDALYKNQSVSVPDTNFGNHYFIKTKATIGFIAYNLINVKTGIYISVREGDIFFAPIAYGSLKLNKSISIFGEFAPFTEFNTLQNYKYLNRYYRFNNFVNTFTENKSNLKIAAKYEYEKYFEISAGIGYLNSDNNFYFEDSQEELGYFRIHKEDTENSYLFVNMLFRKGPFGEFYGEAKFQNIKGENNNYLPYKSSFISSLNYRYDWNNIFGLSLGLLYLNEAYLDYKNENKIPESLNLKSLFYYELFKNFKITLEFENLLNEKYYYFRNYRAKPFDVLAGFEFKW